METPRIDQRARQATRIPRARLNALIAASPYRAQRVFSLDVDGRRVWVKHGTKDYRNALQRLLGTLASLPLRRMTPARQRVYSEVVRIRDLRRAGFRVPQVVCIGVDYVALSDLGPTLDAILRGDTVSEEVRGMARQAAVLLAELHNAGQWHGAARVRNFTVAPDGLGMIDFEDPVDGLPHLYNSLMDMFMLTLSLVRREPTGRLAREALDAYGARRSLAGFRIAAFLLLPTYLMMRLFQPKLGTDGRQVVTCLGAVYRDAAQRTAATARRIASFRTP